MGSSVLHSVIDLQEVELDEAAGSAAAAAAIAAAAAAALWQRSIDKVDAIIGCNER